ncbi:MAG: hypothetical protein ACKO9Q_02580, partial [Pirellula sp.]
CFCAKIIFMCLHLNSMLNPANASSNRCLRLNVVDRMGLGCVLCVISFVLSLVKIQIGSIHRPERC